jgi:hypothetical protein
MQRANNPKLVAGSRIRLSHIGIERCPRLKSRTGLVVRIKPTGTSFRVLIDGHTLHQSYVEPDEEETSLQRG